MPRNPWTYRKRKRGKKGKNKVSEAESNEDSNLPDSGDVATVTGILPDKPINVPVETVSNYPHTRAHSSTAFSPAKRINKSYSPSETSSKISNCKRNKVPEAELGELSNLPDFGGASSQLLSNLNCSVKNELHYPDTRFLRSTTLFPAMEIGENRLPSESSTEISKRVAEDEILPITTKKVKIGSDSASTVEPTVSDEVMIIETPKAQVKVEVIDLTDESCPINPILCSPVRTSYLGNVKVETKGKQHENTAGTIGSTDLNNHIIQTKTKQNKAMENTSEIITDESHAGVNKTINTPVDKTSHIEVKSKNDLSNHSTNSMTNSISTNSMDQSPIEPPVYNQVRIKTEQSKSNEACFEQPQFADSNLTDTLTHNIFLPSDFSKENIVNRGASGQVSNTIFSKIDATTSVDPLLNAVSVKVERPEKDAVNDNSVSESGSVLPTKLSEKNRDNREINNQVQNSNPVFSSNDGNPLPYAVPIKVELTEKYALNGNSVSFEQPQVAVSNHVTTSVDALLNTVPIKVERTENGAVNDKSVSESNLFPDVNQTGMNFVNVPEKNDLTNSNESFKSSENYIPDPSIPANVSPGILEIPPHILHGIEQLSNAIKKQQTEKKIKDSASHYSVKNEDAQENVVYDGNKTGFHSTFNTSVTAIQTRNEPEKMDFLEDSCNYERSQNSEALSQQSTDSNKESSDIELSEALLTNKFNGTSISPVTGGGIFNSRDSQLYQPGTFRTPLLKYLNCNTKINVPQVSRAQSVVNNIIMDKREISVTEINEISNFAGSPSKSDSCISENRGELSNRQAGQTQSLNLKLDQILNDMSSWSNLKEVLNSNPHVTNLPSESHSFSHAHDNSNQLFRGLVGHQPLFPSLHLPGKVSSLTHHHNSSEIDRESISDPPLPASIPSPLPPLPPSPFLEQSSPISSNHSSNSSHRKLAATKHASAGNVPSTELSFESLVPVQMKEDLGRKVIKSRQVQNSLNDVSFDNEKRQTSSPFIGYGSPSRMSESSEVSHSDSSTIYFNSPMDIDSPVRENHPSAVRLPSFDGNKRNDILKTPPMVATKIVDELSNDFLRQIIGKAKSTEKFRDISNASASSSSPDPVNQSNIVIDDTVFQNLRQINLLKNKSVGDTNSSSNANENSSGHIMQNSTFSVPREKIYKRTLDTLSSPSSACNDYVEAPPKKVKKSEDASTSKKKLSLDEYKKRDSRAMDHQRYPHDHRHFTKDFGSESPSDSISSFSNFEQNLYNRSSHLNRDHPIYSDTSLQNPGYPPNTNYLQDPRLARKQSSSLRKDVNSQKQFDSFNVSQTYPSQSISNPTNPSAHPPLKPSISTYANIRNSSNLPSADELFRPSVNIVERQLVRHTQSEFNKVLPSDPRTAEKGRRFLLSSPPSESHSFSHAHDNSDQSFRGQIERQPLLPSPHLPGKVSSLTHHHNSSGIDRESISNPPLPASIPSLPPLPPSPFLEESSPISSNHSSNSSHRKLAATKHASARSFPSTELSFESLVPVQLKEDLGRKVIKTNEVYLIIIEKNIEWILGIDKQMGLPRISEIGGEYQLVRDNYTKHLMHYNTYFPQLLLECFSKISLALKSIVKERERTIKYVCKVVGVETMLEYVTFTCDSFVSSSEVDNIPKDNHLILVRFSTKSKGNFKMLGYVCHSATRDYSHKHDHAHDILKFVHVNRRTDLKKIKIVFNIVFAIPVIDLDAPIQITKVTSIKKILMMNEALKELRVLPLCEAVLNPRNHMKFITLPRRQDSNAMNLVVQEIVKSYPSPSLLTIVRCAPFTDSFLAIVQIVDEMQNSNLPGKILVCVRSEVLSQMGMNLIETTRNIVIINREKENLHPRLTGRILDEMCKHMSKALEINEESAKVKVLQEAEVLLAVTGSCFYEDVKCVIQNLMYCIIHDAHSFTEPESLLPVLYGIRHLMLFGDPDESCHVNSRAASTLGYNKSLFHRAYNLC